MGLGLGLLWETIKSMGSGGSMVAKLKLGARSMVAKLKLGLI